MAGGPQDLSELEKDPRLFLYTSLTAGSSHIVTATSRIETILKANRIPFQFIDTATDEKAKRLWGRRAGKRKLPALVKEGFVIGDLEQVEEWNEFGELKEAIGPVPPAGAPVAPVLAPPLPVKPTATAGSSKVTPTPATTAAPKQERVALPGAAEIAARNNPLPKSSPDDAAKPETMASAPAEKEKSIQAASAISDSKADHLSAPPSAIPSGAATPAEKKEVEEDKKEESKEEVKTEGTKPTETDKNKYEHLSVPASAIQSGTATPAETSEETKVSEESKPDAKVVDAPEEDVKKVEKDTKISEEPVKEATEKKEGDEDVAAVAEGVEGMQVGEGKTVGEQEAKKPEDAVKSVED